MEAVALIPAAAQAVRIQQRGRQGMPLRRRINEHNSFAINIHFFDAVFFALPPRPLNLNIEEECSSKKEKKMALQSMVRGLGRHIHGLTLMCCRRRECGWRVVGWLECA